MSESLKTATSLFQTPLNDDNQVNTSVTLTPVTKPMYYFTFAAVEASQKKICIAALLYLLKKAQPERTVMMIFFSCFAALLEPMFVSLVAQQTEYTFHPIAVRTLSDFTLRIRDEDDMPPRAQEASTQELWVIGGLYLSDGTLAEDLESCTNDEFFAVLSLCLFCMTKTSKPEKFATVITSRARAFSNAANLSANTFLMSAVPTNPPIHGECAYGLMRAFEAAPILRSYVVRLVIDNIYRKKLAGYGSFDVALDLMKGSKLTHVAAIEEIFFVKYPFLLQMPEFRNGVVYYLDSLMKLEMINSSWRPWFKATNPEYSSLFNRNPLGVMTGVAAALKKKTDPSWRAYETEFTPNAALMAKVEASIEIHVSITRNSEFTRLVGSFGYNIAAEGMAE